MYEKSLEKPYCLEIFSIQDTVQDMCVLWSNYFEQNGRICNLAKNDHVQRAKKPTSSVPTKMFDHSNERSWPKLFKNRVTFQKILI